MAASQLPQRPCRTKCGTQGLGGWHGPRNVVPASGMPRHPDGARLGPNRACACVAVRVWCGVLARLLVLHIFAESECCCRHDAWFGLIITSLTVTRKGCSGTQ